MKATMTVSQAELRSVLHERSRGIVEGWYQAVRTSLIALHSPSKLRGLLSDVWGEVRAFLLRDAGQPRDAVPIGAFFAELGIRPGDIGPIQQVLLACLLDELPEDVDRALRARLPPLVEGLTTGFIESSTEKLLDEQEEIRGAYERSLREAEDRLRVLNAGVRSSINAIVMVDLEGRITYVNSAFLEMWGYESDREVLGRHHYDFGEWRTDIEQALMTLVEQRGLIGESVAVRADGSRFHVQASVSPIQDDAGRVTYLMGFFVDVTDRKRTQDALERRAAQMASLNEIGEELAKLLAPDQVLEKAVRLARESFGYHQVTVLTLDGDNGQLVVRAVASAASAEQAGERRVPLEDGISGWVVEQGRMLVANGVGTERRCADGASDSMPTGSELAVPIQGAEGVVGVLDVWSPRLTAFTPTDQIILKTLADHIAVSLENARLYEAVQQELSQRREAEERLLRHVKRLETLRELDQEILIATSAQEVAEAALGRLRQLVPCQRASIDLLDVENEEIVVLAALQTIGEGGARTGCRFPLTQREALSDLWGRRAWLYISDAGTLPESSPLVRTVREEGLQSFLTAPIRSRKDLLGLLALGSDRLDGFEPEEHGPIVQEVADLVAIAIQQTRLLDSVSRQRERLRTTMARLAEVEEQERRRVVRELHDQVGQNLTALDLNLSLVRSRLDRQGLRQLAARLDDSFELLEQTNERIRQLMVDLRPPVLDDYGLLSALHWYGDQFSARTGIAVAVKGDEDAARDLPPHVENALFRIAQEALNNVAKHAQADAVTITLATDDAVTSLAISDNGQGFSREDLEGQTSTWGLLTMRERAESVGARCRFGSAREGARVVVEVPA